ncbi:13743_t:CDS:2 [Ambispora leptoticha]|uniref:13743_t:CDS:1 n=1 Tax=Ambispora leptoticha TaxID=144679 RepID=A0A9N9B9P2_9GLOM|nr:13743_t:CDS:2 [Ambispora leptoticha]
MLTQFLPCVVENFSLLCFMLVDCANKAFSSALVCPACDTSLTENDDIVFADLNPSEDYKSSVLSGLRPDFIMEICTRALSFWTYQTTQEACFQEMLYKNLEDKYNRIEKNLQVVMRDAHTEINSLREKVSALQKEIELEKRKSHDLSEQLQEKGRQFSKLQVMYDKLKRRTLVPTMQQTVQNVAGNSSIPGINGTSINNLGGNGNMGSRQVPIGIQSNAQRRQFGENLGNLNHPAWPGGGTENSYDPFYGPPPSSQQHHYLPNVKRSQQQSIPVQSYRNYHEVTPNGQPRNPYSTGQNSGIIMMPPNTGMRG